MPKWHTRNYIRLINILSKGSANDQRTHSEGPLYLVDLSNRVDIDLFFPQLETRDERLETNSLLVYWVLWCQYGDKTVLRDKSLAP